MAIRMAYNITETSMGEIKECFWSKNTRTVKSDLLRSEKSGQRKEIVLILAKEYQGEEYFPPSLQHFLAFPPKLFSFFLYLFLFLLGICFDLAGNTCHVKCTIVFLQSSKGHLWELVLFFHHVGPEAQVQFVKISARKLYPLSHLSISMILLEITIRVEILSR